MQPGSEVWSPGFSLMPFGNSGFSRRMAVPEGLHENSPALKRRERCPEVSSPEGTAESCSFGSLFQPSLRDSFDGWPRPGVEMPGYSHLSLRDNLPRISESHRL